jgi:hypothetical protein
VPAADASYLAIRKDALDGGWLASPSIDGEATVPLAATELVWLRAKGDKVYLFVSSPRPLAGAVDPPKLRASYRIIDRPELAGASSADDYVFVELPATR